MCGLYFAVFNAMIQVDKNRGGLVSTTRFDTPSTSNSEYAVCAFQTGTVGKSLAAHSYSISVLMSKPSTKMWTVFQPDVQASILVLASVDQLLCAPLIESVSWIIFDYYIVTWSLYSDHVITARRKLQMQLSPRTRLLRLIALCCRCWILIASWAITRWCWCFGWC